MGRQVRFYFTAEDEATVIGLPHFARAVYLSLEMERLPRYRLYSELNTPAAQVSHWQMLICLDSDLAGLKYRGSGRSGFYVCPVANPVIEFTRSRYDAESNMLISGRIWYEPKDWVKDQEGNSILVVKSREMEKLYESLARWIRKHCRRLPGGNYIGTHAEELMKAGARLSGP